MPMVFEEKLDGSGTEIPLVQNLEGDASFMQPNFVQFMPPEEPMPPPNMNMNGEFIDQMPSN